MKALRCTAILLGIILLLGTSSITHAQQSSLSSNTQQTANELTVIDNPEAVRELVSRLSDNEVRDLLLQQLDALASKQATENTSDEIGLFTLITTNIPISIHAAVSVFPTMISGQIEIFRIFIDRLGPNGFLKLLGAFLTAIAAGLLIEMLVRRITLRWRSTSDVSAPTGHSLQEILKLLSLRFVLDMSGLLAFIIVTQIVL